MTSDIAFVSSSDYPGCPGFSKGTAHSTVFTHHSNCSIQHCIVLRKHFYHLLFISSLHLFLIFFFNIEEIIQHSTDRIFFFFCWSVIIFISFLFNNKFWNLFYGFGVIARIRLNEELGIKIKTKKWIWNTKWPEREEKEFQYE